MKRLRVFFVLLSIVILLSACSSVEINGLENYHPADCSVGLSTNLFPSEDFLTAHPYVDGDYQYYDSGDLGWGYATAFAQLRYPSDGYAKAKAYCLEELELCEIHQYEYNGYQFFEHLCYEVKNEAGELIVDCDYPRIFNMFAYNDQNCTLVFLGYYNGDPNNAESQLAETDFSAFLDNTFSDCYDFSA